MVRVLRVVSDAFVMLNVPAGCHWHIWPFFPRNAADLFKNARPNRAMIAAFVACPCVFICHGIGLSM
jgi:hypothetical protein